MQEALRPLLLCERRQRLRAAHPLPNHLLPSHTSRPLKARARLRHQEFAPCARSFVAASCASELKEARAVRSEDRPHERFREFRKKFPNRSMIESKIYKLLRQPLRLRREVQRRGSLRGQRPSPSASAPLVLRRLVLERLWIEAPGRRLLRRRAPTEVLRESCLRACPRTENWRARR